MKKVIIIVLLILNVTIFPAQADDSISPERKGFLFGVGVGGGLLVVQDEDIDTNEYGKYSILNLKLGWMVTPQTAVCLHVPSGGHSEDGETRAFEAILITGQHWFTKRIWAMAGLGLAMDMPPFYETEDDDPDFYFGTAVSAGLGYEILQRESFVLDLQARCLYGNYEVETINRQSFATDLLIGFNWY